MKDFKRGPLATAPLTPGVVAFGLLYGVIARQVGFSAWEAWAMSLIVHAGSAQFVTLGMWTIAGPGPIILTTLVINLRHLLMGASVAPHLRGLSSLWRASLALRKEEKWWRRRRECGIMSGSHTRWRVGRLAGFCLLEE
jgi:predicted branched-subunit amino acid permease